jgi:hypothetical protein
MRLSLFKQIWQEYVKHEIDSPSTDRTGSSIMLAPIGKIVYQDFNVQGFPVKEMVLNRTNTKGDTDFFALLTTTGEFSIVVHDDALATTPDQKFRAIMAHEIGHYVMGHFEDWHKKKTKNQVLYHDSKLFDLLNKYEKDRSDFNFYKAQRHMLKSLLRGSILRQELEADYGASKYVSKQDIIYIHSTDMKQDNPIVSLEKRNRIDFISRNFDDYPPNSDGSYFKLEIHFDTGAVL